MRKFTAFLLMVAPFLYTGLYASSADSKKAAWKYIDILDAQKQERERADANIEKAMTLPPQDAANACLSEWGVAEVTQETDPKRLFAVLANHVRNTNSVNSQFGYTFSEKNKPVMHDFIKGVESWDKGLCIPDVGAGKGFSALYLANEIFTILTGHNITPSSPIQIYVSDLMYGDYLHNLAIVINAAFSPHIEMTAQTIDLTNSYQLAKEPVDQIFAFNVFHYLPCSA